jgi:hypothetical protein
MFNRSAIMTAAWDILRNRMHWTGGRNLRLFSRALMSAWHEAKLAILRAGMSEADRMREAISMLDNKDTWSDADYAKSDKLYADLRVAVEHEAAATEYEEKRALIAAAAGRFCSVTFTKKDGSQRVMRIQPVALRSHIKGESASHAAQQAVQTRAGRHPHLLPVWDTEAASARSVNLATISRIAIDGAVHHFAS